MLKLCFFRDTSGAVSTHKRIFTTIPSAMMELDSGFAPSNLLLFYTMCPHCSKITKRALSERSITNDNSVYCEPRRKRSEKCCRVAIQHFPQCIPKANTCQRKTSLVKPGLGRNVCHLADKELQNWVKPGRNLAHILD